MRTSSPFAPFLAEKGFVLLDGGLATALEERGHDLDHDLWSARMLLDDPSEIREVHRAYLEAGVDCVTTASYQASLPGFAAVGLDESTGTELLLRSTDLAVEARDAFLASTNRQRSDTTPFSATDSPVRPRRRPLVAASVGPYGAYLADGSEYVGAYGVDASTLDAFHRDRFGLLAGSGVDVLACETIPSRLEAGVLLSILDDHPNAWAWLSFTCPDEEHVSDGTAFEEVVEMCGAHDRVAAVGVNCSPPHVVPELMRRARRVTDLPLMAYPNSGELYDAGTRRWLPRAAASTGDAWLDSMIEARAAGASVLGGCCRTGPERIARLRDALAGGD